jgi:pimeloyl-ACP methyl ester carboxylesterase
MSDNTKMICVQGLDFQVRDVGDQQPALVFLHYWGGTGRTWGLVIRELADRHRCVAPDLRGWGGSDKKTDDYDLHTQADDVAAIIASLGLSQYILVGQSMGGKVAQILGARRPNGLKGLVLVAPAPPVPIAAPKEQREAMLESYQSPAGVELALSILTSRQLSPELRRLVIDDTLGGCGGQGSMDADRHDARYQRHRREYRCPHHRHRRGCRQGRERASPETGAGPSH